MVMPLHEIPDPYLQLNHLDVLDLDLSRDTDEASLALRSLSTLPNGMQHTAGYTYPGIGANLRVNAAVIAWRPSDRFVGQLNGTDVPANEKQAAIHAVPMAIAKAQRLGFKRLLSIATWGPSQPDEQSGLIEDTHQPCYPCREIMMGAPEIDEKTLLVSTNGGLTCAQIYTLPELIARHETPEDPRLALTPFSTGLNLHFLYVGLLQKWSKLYPDHPATIAVRGIADEL
jgi:cytidine deaminase